MMDEHEAQFGHAYRTTKGNSKRCAECHRLTERRRYRSKAAGPDWDGTWDPAARLIARRKPVCANGHEFVEGSFIWTADKRGPWRRCLQCNRDDLRSAYHRRMAEEQDYAVRNMLNNHNVRARKFGDSNQLTVEDAMWLWDTLGVLCLACGSADEPTLDHVIPTSVGGLNVADNLQPLCKPCNNRKYNKTIDYRPTAGTR